MTRARDELDPEPRLGIARAGGHAAFRRSWSRRWTCRRRASAARRSHRRSTRRGRWQRIAAAEPPAESPEAERTPIEGPLMLSHSAIDAYLTCPLRYKYAQVVRIPTTPHHSMVYGAALHQAVQEFHRSQARGRPLTEAELLAVFEAAWSNEGFLSREHETARLEAGRAVAARCSASPSSSPAPSSRHGSSASSRSRSVATGSAGASTASTSCRSRRPRTRSPASSRRGSGPVRPARRRGRADARAARAGGGDDHRLQVERRARSRRWLASGRAIRSSSRSTRWPTRR